MDTRASRKHPMAGHQRRQLSEVCRYRELRAEHGKWGEGSPEGTEHPVCSLPEPVEAQEVRCEHASLAGTTIIHTGVT